VSPAPGASAVIWTFDWESPVTGWFTKRNWSPMPLMPEPAALTVRTPPLVDSLPLAGLLMSWQV
jgi:hypothetical protein